MGAHNIKQTTLSSELADLISSKQNELTREQVEAIGRILNSLLTARPTLKHL